MFSLISLISLNSLFTVGFSMLRARFLVRLGSPLATLHCSASALQTSLNALGLIAMLQLLPFHDKMGGTLADCR